MRKLTIILPVFLFTYQFMLSSCTKTVTHTVTVKDTVITYPITGLWHGTYASPLNGTAVFELDFSIFADSTLTYYSTGSGNTQFSAVGNWSLSGTNFSFSVVVNSAGIENGQAQNGTGVYNPNTGTLTGTIQGSGVGSSGSWTMSKVY